MRAINQHNMMPRNSSSLSSPDSVSSSLSSCQMRPMSVQRCLYCLLNSINASAETTLKPSGHAMTWGPRDSVVQ